MRISDWSSDVCSSDLKTRLGQAGNGTLSDADRATLADVLSSAKANMLALANGTDGNGQYLFSGLHGDMAPYTQDASGTVTWQGDTGQRNIQVDQTWQLAGGDRSEEHTSELQSLMRISY